MQEIINSIKRIAGHAGVGSLKLKSHETDALSVANCSPNFKYMRTNESTSSRRRPPCPVHRSAETASHYRMVHHRQWRFIVTKDGPTHAITIVSIIIGYYYYIVEAAVAYRLKVISVLIFRPRAGRVEM